MDKITYKFSTGAEITGTVEEIEKVAKALGEKLDYSVFKGKIPRGFYPSKSKGVIRVADMGEFHLRRALLKRTKDYYSEMYDAGDTKTTFLRKYTDLENDPIVVDLFAEINKR